MDRPTVAGSRSCLVPMIDANASNGEWNGRGGDDNGQVGVESRMSVGVQAAVQAGERVDRRRVKDRRILRG